MVRLIFRLGDSAERYGTSSFTLCERVGQDSVGFRQIPISHGAMGGHCVAVDGGSGFVERGGQAPYGYSVGLHTGDDVAVGKSCCFGL